MSTDIKVPYILTCRVSGQTKAYTSKEFVARKIENYGGNEQAMIDGYVTKEAKRLLKPFGENLTVADVAGVIKTLGGSTDAQAVFDLIKGGTLFLTKKVKVRAKADGEGKKGAAASKKGRTAKKMKVAKKKGKKAAKKKPAKKKAAKVAAPEATAQV